MTSRFGRCCTRGGLLSLLAVCPLWMRGMSRERALLCGGACRGGESPKGRIGWDIRWGISEGDGGDGVCQPGSR